MDDLGETPDWIELYNPGTEPVDLEGWGLSDDEDNPRRWVFEQGTVEPGEFFVVFASGEDRQDEISPHTNFAISSAGEPLILTGPDGNVVDFVPEIPVPTNISRGRKPDGGEDWFYFGEPTPGAPNTTTAYSEILDPPTFSHEGGFYTEPFGLTIEAPDPDAAIVYTLDGSIPAVENIGGTSYYYKPEYQERPPDPPGELSTRTIESMEHAGEGIPIVDRSPEPDSLSGINTTWRRDASHYAPIEASFKGTPVRAIAVREGALPSEVTTHTYFVTEQGRSRYSLPVIALSIQENHLFDYEDGIYVPGILFDQWRDSNPDRFPTHSTSSNYRRRGRQWEFPAWFEYFEDEPHAAVRQGLGARIHGGGSRYFALKSFRLYARNAYDDKNTLDYPLIPGLTDQAEGRPITEFRRFLLRNSGNDYPQTMLRDAFLQEIVKPLGFDQQGYNPTIVFLNGEFWGILNIRERIDRHYLARQHLIDPEEVGLLSNNAQVQDGSFQNRWDFLDLRAYIAQNDMDDPEHFDHVAEQMDIENFIQYNALQIIINNIDWPGNNIDFWRKQTPDRSKGAPESHDGRWRWIVYDLDLAFHQTGSQGQYDVDYDMLSHATKRGGVEWPNPDWSTTMLRNLLESEEFRNGFINALADQMNSIFRPENLEPVLDRMHARIAPHLDEHRARWRNSAQWTTQHMKDWGHERPGYVRQHVLDFFDLPGTAEVTLDTSTPRRGAIRINNLTIEPHLEGLADPGQSFPWTGVYFQTVPIGIEAVPKAGFAFSQWEGDLAGSPREVTVETPEELSATAVFVPDQDYPWKGILPEAHALAAGPYISGPWPRNADPGTYPPNMVFRQIPVGDPLLADEPDELWTHPYDLESRSRVTGLYELGFAFINTSNPQDDGGGYVTGAELAIDTQGATSAFVRFTAGTLRPNSRQYALRLQYRLGPEGQFRDVLDAGGDPIEYVRNEEQGHEQEFGPIALPQDAMDQPYVTLRWKYYYIETGITGPRAKLSLRDIEAEAIPENAPTWVWR